LLCQTSEKFFCDFLDVGLMRTTTGHRVRLFIEETEYKNTTHSIDGVDLYKNL
jgi:hypothetical protein